MSANGIPDDFDIDAIIRQAFKQEAHPFVDTQVGVPGLLRRIGAPCGQCYRPGGDPIHRAVAASDGKVDA